MMIATVQAFTGAGLTSWNGIPTTCHMATLYWLYQDEFGHAVPDQATYLDHFGNPTACMARVMAMGQRLSRPGHGAANLVPGTVLIFERNNQPGHSCVAVGAQLIGGYNQLNWFTGAGANHNYSTHATSQIVWRGAMHPQEVQGNVVGHWYHLIAVPEGMAKAVVRQIVQG